MISLSKSDRVAPSRDAALLLLNGPTRFSEADVITEELFDEEVDQDPDAGDEHFHWTATDLSRRVRPLLECQERD